MTTEEQLASVRVAIAAIESGAQEYQVNGKRVRRGDLKTLYDREMNLMRQMDGETYGNRMAVAWADR